MVGFGKRRQRHHLRRQPFPPEWLRIIERNVPLYAKLPPEDQREMQGDIQIFLAEKHFEGCGGLAISDEIRVTIAAQACLLLLHRENDDYPRLDSPFSSTLAPTWRGPSSSCRGGSFTRACPPGSVRRGPAAR